MSPLCPFLLTPHDHLSAEGVPGSKEEFLAYRIIYQVGSVCTCLANRIVAVPG